MAIKDIYKKIIITVLTISLTVLFIVKLSYASFNVQESSEKTVLTFWDINIELCYSSECSQENEMLGNIIGTSYIEGQTRFIPQYPINDSEYIAKVVPYKFIVENKGALDTYLTLYLEPNRNTLGGTTTESRELPNTADITGQNAIGTNNSYTQTYTTFVQDNQFKYFNVVILEENTDIPLIKTYDSVVANKNELVTNINLPSGSKKAYLLYMWLSNEELNKYTSDENINEVLGKYIVTSLFAKGEYKPN